ncbi:MAG TPA: hypothetical protein PLZ52_03160 [Bacteroidales bacterium]|nr:hypothetical protein [Bacteroidales bacterium]HOE04192.1 hypothetical protein [Bacteroidales bacterium]HQL70831.1 hypothetical protein [Bacteroidales bacterium]
MKILKNSYILIIAVLSLAWAASCERNDITTNPEDLLLFSDDTVQFDTIFTGVGSTTNYFVVYNQNKNKSINIDRIFLARGNQSKYRLNIDGRQTRDYSDMLLAPGDSAFIFVEVTINPGTDDMVEQDSVVFISNGNTQDVDLIAFGQNVLLIDGQIFGNDTTITSAKPVLIYNSALIDENVTLTVQAGTHFHFHKNSSLLVQGTLKVQGSTEEPVIFQGDRLEEGYSEISGQWGAYIDTLGVRYLLGGLHFLAGSKHNEIDNAVIKNGVIGIRVDTVVTPGVPCLILRNTAIENMNVAGLYSIGTHVEAYNCVFANCGQYTVACLYGGNYSFYHCTLANYWSGNRQTSQLVLNNYFFSGSQLYTRPLTKAYFGNCIIYGNKEEEINLDLTTETTASFYFDNCLIKAAVDFNVSNPVYFRNTILNENPKFKETISPYDYQLDTLSPAKDAGDPGISISLPFDLNNVNRMSDTGPDLGAFERIE